MRVLLFNFSLFIHFARRILSVCLPQGLVMAQGTYSELQNSGLDAASLLRSDEEPERRSRSAEPDKLSLHSSHCSYSSLPQQDSARTDQLPVRTFSR